MNKLYAFLLVFLVPSALLTISVHPVKASGDLWIERAPLHIADYSFGTISVKGKFTLSVAISPTPLILPLIHGFQNHQCQATGKALLSLPAKIKSTL